MQRELMAKPRLPLVLLALALGCWRPLEIVQDKVGSMPPGPRMPANPRPGSGPGAARDTALPVAIATKPVVGKEAPVTLFARDGTSCVVPESKFREVVLGQRVRCGWR